jgi:hypothetical protein
MRCHRPIKRESRAGMGPVCARKVLWALTAKKARAEKPEPRQMELLEAH